MSGDAAMQSRARFGARLLERVLARESQIVLGIDPDPAKLWPEGDRAAAEDAGPVPERRAAQAVLAHCLALIDAAGEACVAVKPQLACFERLGAAGREVLGEVVEHAHAAGLLVIADGKRGDIDVSARAYAESLFTGTQTPFGEIGGLGADAVTVNPLMGRDAIAPFIAAARGCGGGVLLLVRTSNAGAADIQDLPTTSDRQRTVWERLADLAREAGQEGVDRSGLSDVGAVVGATAPQHLSRARELMPHAVILMPGVGAQGGSVQDLRPAFAPGPAGGLITASRSIANAHLHSGERPGPAARREAERLRAAAWGLSR